MKKDIPLLLQKYCQENTGKTLSDFFDYIGEDYQTQSLKTLIEAHNRGLIRIVIEPK